MEELRFAIKNNALVSIDDVPSGLMCNCTCPHCHAALVAKKGKKRKHHFAHYSAVDCEHGAESALHIMAKNIIAETKTLWVPSIPKDVYDRTSRGKVIQFENASLEQQLSPQVRSDVLLKALGRQLNVEIKVTHEVDVEKQINLFNEGINTIEIDLSSLIDNYTEDMVRCCILDGRYTKLIYSTKAKSVFAKLLLGDWKKFHMHRYGHGYVDNCPLNAGKAYYVDSKMIINLHECHECCGAEEYSGGQWFLCRSLFGNLDFSSIDKIIKIERVEGILQYAELIIGGERRIFERKK